MIAAKGSAFAAVAVLLVTTWLGYGGGHPGSPDSERQAPFAEVGCALARPPKRPLPDLVCSKEALARPQDQPGLRRAYFALGCFWGTEARLGSLPGVVFTRVGFAGGSTPSPSYGAKGDHAETVEVLYDPRRTDYATLLEAFWSEHNPFAAVLWGNQVSAVFCTEASEVKVAHAVRSQRLRQGGSDPLSTRIAELPRFYPADDGHQKYYLAHDPDLLACLEAWGPAPWDFALATKLNAVVARKGSPEHLRQALRDLGVSQEAGEALLIRAGWP